MKRIFWAGLSLIAATSMARANDLPTPGLYEVHTEILQTNMPMAPQPDVMRHCITETDIKKALEKTLEPDMDFQQCAKRDITIGSGKLAMALDCTIPGGQVTMTLNGTYTATSYETINRIDINAAGMTKFMHTKSTAKRAGACAKK